VDTVTFAPGEQEADAGLPEKIPNFSQLLVLPAAITTPGAGQRIPPTSPPGKRKGPGEQAPWELCARRLPETTKQKRIDAAVVVALDAVERELQKAKDAGVVLNEANRRSYTRLLEADTFQWTAYSARAARRDKGEEDV